MPHLKPLLLDKETRDDALTHLPEWQLGPDGKMIKRDFRFDDFTLCFAFMTAIALKAERMNHHPEWSNVYNRLTICLSTHDCKGISTLDITLATYIDGLFKKI